MRRRPRTGAVGVVAVRSARTASRGSERSTLTPSTRRVRRKATPERLPGCNGCFMLCERRGAGPRGGRYRQLASTRRPASTASELWSSMRLGLLDCSHCSAWEQCCFRAPDAPQHFRFSRFRLKVDQRTLHGPHRCALSLKRAAVAWRSVAHATHGWHCCSPERRGPAGTQVTRAVEEWSQRSLSLLVCAAGHLWPPHGARRIVHAPRVRRPSPLKAREAAQG